VLKKKSAFVVPPGGGVWGGGLLGGGLAGGGDDGGPIEPTTLTTPFAEIWMLTGG
jgi:hypothetical protein